MKRMPDAKYFRAVTRGAREMYPQAFMVNNKLYVVPLDEAEKAELREWFKGVPGVTVGIPIVRVDGKCYVPPITRQKAREIMEDCSVW